MSTPRIPHSPLGANASFDFGPPGEPAGFAPSDGLASAQNIFVGCRTSRLDAWNLLPFFSPTAHGPQPLPKGRYGRFLAWAGDKWMIGPLVFKLCTPFPLRAIDDRFAYAPVVCGYLEYDNSHSADTAELIFGLGGLDARSLSAASLVGSAFTGDFGFATGSSSEVEPRSDAALFNVEIGPAAALHFVVPPQSKRIFPLVLGFFQRGFHYTSRFSDLASVLAHGLAEHSRYLGASDSLDAAFMRSAAPFDVKTRVALETRAWLAQTRRLVGEPPVDTTPLQALAHDLGQ